MLPTSRSMAKTYNQKRFLEELACKKIEKSTSQRKGNKIQLQESYKRRPRRKTLTMIQLVNKDQHKDKKLQIFSAIKSANFLLLSKAFLRLSLRITHFLLCACLQKPFLRLLPFFFSFLSVRVLSNCVVLRALFSYFLSLYYIYPSPLVMKQTGHNHTRWIPKWTVRSVPCFLSGLRVHRSSLSHSFPK